MKYRIHYANGKHEEIESDETREQLLAQCKPIIDVVSLEDAPAPEVKHQPKSKKKGQE